MSSLLFQGQLVTGLTEDEAASTIEPIRTDPSEAELEKAPEWNAVESDDSGQLVGLSPRVVGSSTEAPEKSPPFIGIYDASAKGNDKLDAQVASSGSAAARESAGQFGHGTIETVIGIEPLNPAQEYGNDYFAFSDPGIQYGSGQYMQPPESDNWAQAVAQSRANAAARDAFRSTQYERFMG